MRRRTLTCITLTLVLSAGAAPAYACGGLVGPNGAVNLLRTTTLAAYHDGVEHYVTSFQFAGAEAGEFGSIVPLPGVPSKVERGGDWTLQRLAREVEPPAKAAFALASADGTAERSARVLLQTRIDALDITILEGGADEVARWAEANGFRLSPDAPEVLEFYAKRSQIFMAARFDAAAAAERGQRAGDGTPIHLTIPTANPWVPLRILGLGKQAAEPVEADVFLLTERAPELLPTPVDAPRENRPAAEGMFQLRSEPASDSLLRDLRSDKGMDWIPRSMWLTFLRLNTTAAQAGYDLAIDVRGGSPSPAAAGLPAGLSLPREPLALSWVLALALAGVAAVVAGRFARRPVMPAR